MPASTDVTSMALFCDFENIALGVRDANHEKFDIKKVLERLLLKGSIVVKKAYCDWERYKTFKGAMHEANFELIEIPHVRQSGKNSADIRMVVDALDLCYTKEHVDTFVIISGDSDFSPLVSKLRENAKTVIGVGVKNSTSDLLIANCDEFIFYDDLVREQRKARRATAARESVTGTARPARTAGNGKSSARDAPSEDAPGTVAGVPDDAASQAGVDAGVDAGGAAVAPAKAARAVSETAAAPAAGSAAKVGRVAGASAAKTARATKAAKTTKAAPRGKARSGAIGDAAHSGADGGDAPVATGSAEASGAAAPAQASDAHAPAAIEVGRAAAIPDEARSEPDRRREAGIAIVVDTLEALSAERGSDRIYGSMIKQAIKRVRPQFSESFHGFRSFNAMLEAAQATGALDLARDEKSGGYVVRLHGAAA